MHHSFEMNGHKFYVRRFDPFTALGTLADLQKLILAPLLKGASGKELKDQAQIAEALLGGLEGISGKMGKAEVVALARMLIDPEYVTVEIKLDNGAYAEPVKLRDNVVPGVMVGAADIITLCTEVVKVNYSDFLAPLAPLISKAGSLVQSQLENSVKN